MKLNNTTSCRHDDDDNYDQTLVGACFQSNSFCLRCWVQSLDSCACIRPITKQYYLVPSDIMFFSRETNRRPYYATQTLWHIHFWTQGLIPFHAGYYYSLLRQY